MITGNLRHISSSLCAALRRNCANHTSGEDTVVGIQSMRLQRGEGHLTRSVLPRHSVRRRSRAGGRHSRGCSRPEEGERFSDWAPIICRHPRG